MKVCADSLADLDQKMIYLEGKPIVRCRICDPAGSAAQLVSPKQIDEATSAPVPGRSYVIQGPTGHSTVVEAWAGDYIRFEKLPVWQKDLRDEIRRRCRQLEPEAGQVLQAEFFGAKLPNADVENLVLYNIGTFPIAGRNGIRFEYGSAVPPAPDGAEFRFGYRYALAPRSDSLIHWHQGRELASFDWTDLGAFVGEKKLSQVWLAIAGSQTHVGKPATPETPFAVHVEVRPPFGRQPVWGGLMKGIFDGVICAFQAHTDTVVLPAVVRRLAECLPAQPEKIERLLLDQRQAVLGTVNRLVAPYDAGVKWYPSDHWCVAGELLAAEPTGDRWAIKGKVVELCR